ncbi:PD-(D/E)XK motif protein [uncultured Ruminobacter sp.]|uniref:PD-(D/E)XK motif protein n=1 Tax=uncultured Ruminobacter sp. TaxID=538947 RepID=UPI0025EB54C3|nr:PD-(D/E)XK motif protein [uncultured Ruminobacter sp.]
MEQMNEALLNELWINLERKVTTQQNTLQQLIAPTSLFRLFIGVDGLPTRRFISVEIPENQKKTVLGIKPIQGIDVSVCKPPISHDGYCSCVLQSAAHDQNDVFSIVASDILFELNSCKSNNAYVDILVERIAKWREFFKRKHNSLSDSEIIGLIGELQFAEDIMSEGFGQILDSWSGPIKSAHDYKMPAFLAEIKAKSTDQLTSVKISSEEQLNREDDSPLFLVVYRLEESPKGMNLHDKVQSVALKLSDSRKSIFYAKLLCIGYQKEENYSKKYIVKERRQYRVENDFPRIITPNLPSGTFGVVYNLSIEKCTPYQVDFNQVIDCYKEALNG